MTVLGAVVLPTLPPERLRAVAEAAETSGLDELWLWEDCFRQSGLASLSAALAWTSRLRVGVGLLPVPLRNVALTAMEIATLERMFPGRSRIGVGHGVQDWMGQVGERVSSPLTLLREHVTALRSLLSGEEVSTSGQHVHLDKVRLDWPPDRAPGVMVGTTGPRTLRLSGEIADGTILHAGSSPDDVARARATIEEGRRSAGRHDHHDLVVYVLAGTGPGAGGRVAAEQQSWGQDPSTNTAVTGTAEEIAQGIARWTRAGANTVVLQPTIDEPNPEAFVRFVAEQVRPLTPDLSG